MLPHDIVAALANRETRTANPCAPILHLRKIGGFSLSTLAAFSEVIIAERCSDVNGKGPRNYACQRVAPRTQERGAACTIRAHCPILWGGLDIPRQTQHYA